MVTAAIIVFVYFLLFFIVATIIKNNSIVDIGWGLGFVVVSWILFFINYDLTITKILVNIMVSLWGLRLFYYILQRNIFEKEDFRYANWRKSWGKWVVPRAFLQVFMLQGLLQFLIGSVLFYININTISFHYISLLGVLIWILGYYFEVIGDKELKEHIKNPQMKGKLLKTGLWRLTRHPNYFGEATMWWGIFLFGFINGVPWYFVVSPLIITAVLRFISTPLLEEKMKNYDEWEEYAQETNMLLPIKFNK